MKQAVAPGAWNAEKVDAFKDAFLRFLNYVTIDSKETGPTTLGKTVYEAQRRALECIFAGLANDVHDFKILKSRQLGISTITEALDVFWLGMHEGCQGALIFDTSAHLEKARERRVVMTDITERLDSHLLNDDAEQRWQDADNLIEEALAEIQRLREEVRRLRVEAGYD